MNSSLQLQMNFQPPPGENRFKAALDEGRFYLLFEHASPGRDNDPAASAERLRFLEAAVLGIKNLNAALAITDGYCNLNAWRAIEYATALKEEQRDRHLIYLGGCNLYAEERSSLLKIAASHNLCNIAAAGGDAGKSRTLKELKNIEFSDSVGLIDNLADSGNFFPGAVTNPMQYTPFALMSQYSKLVKKINAGARFIVTQANWDMLKMQSLLWYLNERSIFIPVIARLVLLTPEKVESILDGRMPGVGISADLNNILQKELRFSRAQFEAAQYRRLELQIAGCRLLGCSGIQLAGADTPERAAVAAERVESALDEFKSFDQWLEAYNSYLAKAEMAPYSKSFYLYDRALKRNYPETPPRMNEIPETELTSGEKFVHNLRKFFFQHSSGQHAGSRRMLKTLLCGCRRCDHCRLIENEYICPMLCPKRQLHGVCGEIRPDGRCEYGNFECVQHKIMRLAAAGNRMMERVDRIDV